MSTAFVPAERSTHEFPASKLRSARLDTDMDRFASPSPPSGQSPILRQPETRPITQEQLVNEVKGIYAGLVMVEKKCVEVLPSTVPYMLYRLLTLLRR